MLAPTDPVRWASGWTFCLAIAGVTVGLQFIWTLPALLLRDAGAGFLMVYLIALFGFATPLLAGEIWLGREGRSNPVQMANLLQLRSGSSRFWRLIGPLSLLVSLLLSAYLCLVGGWSLAFGLESANDVFLAQKPEFVIQHLSYFLADAERMVPWFSGFLLMASLISAVGVRVGLAFAVRLLMPMAALLLLVLIAYLQSIGAYGVFERQHFLFDSFTISWSGALAAVSLAFFSLSVGIGGIATCAAYLPETLRIRKAVLGVLCFTLIFAVLITAVVLPILLSTNVEVAQGPPLLLLNLPLAFGSNLHGDYYGALFYTFVVIISLCSTLVLLEPSTRWLQQSMMLPRPIAAAASGGCVWMVTVAISLSFNNWSGYELAEGLSLFRLLETLGTVVLVPLLAALNGGFLVALLRSPQYSARYSPVTLAITQFYFVFICPALLGSVVWYSLQSKQLW